MDGEAEGSAQRGLEGGEGDLAVALGEVRVADVEEGLGDLDGEEEPGAGAEVADVDVPAVRARRYGVDGGFGGRGDAHDAEEGAQREGELAAVADREPAPAVVSDGGHDAGRLARRCLRVFTGEGTLAVPVADHSVGGAAAQVSGLRPPKRRRAVRRAVPRVR